MSTVGVIEYGSGNLGSVLRALEEGGASARLVDKPEGLSDVDRILLPGVGSFADCAELLHAGGWYDVIRDAVLEQDKPLLGICLGMQLLANRSDEGVRENDGRPVAEGLGLIPGHVRHLQDLGCDLRIPHVGWNELRVRDGDGGLFGGIPSGTDVYFAHSYALVPEDPAHVLATTDYGVDLVAAVQSGRVLGTQFHPENSSRAGFQLLRNFVEGSLC